MSLPRKHNKRLRSSPNRRSRSRTPHRTKPYSVKSRCKITRPALLPTPSPHQRALHPRSSLPATLTPPTRVSASPIAPNNLKQRFISETMPSVVLEPKKPAPAFVKAEKKSTWWEKERTPRLVETGAGHAVTVSVNLLTAPKDKHGKGALGTLKALAKGRPSRNAPSPPKIQTQLEYDSGSDSSAPSSPRSSLSSVPPSPPPYDEEPEPVFTPFPRRPLPPRRSDECDRIRDDTPLRHGVLMSQGLRAQSSAQRSSEMAMGPEELAAWLAGMRRQIRRELAEEKEALERVRRRKELSERAKRRHEREMERLDEEKTVARFTCVVKGLAAQARNVRPGGEKSKWLVGYA